MAIDPSIFKAYDIRGLYPAQINEETIASIGSAYVKHFQTKRVIIGADVRLSSPALKDALITALIQSGADVVDIGTINTDMMYFAVSHLKTDGGLIVSASHNPAEYNGLKIVLRDAVPVSSDSGLMTLRDMVVSGNYPVKNSEPGHLETFEILPAYLDHLKKFVDFDNLRPLRIVANGNFGMAGTVVQELLKDTKIKLIPLNEKPDGHFPKGRPDPMWADNRAETVALIQQEAAHLGVAWDADADRCFFFDERGNFINPYYITAMLADQLLTEHPGNKILIDPRLIWATEAVVKQHGAKLIINKAGHTFIKERMRRDDVLFGGEASAHYYFRQNNYTDNGMIPFLLILEAMSRQNTALSALIAKYQQLSCCAEETNFTVGNGKEIVSSLEKHYQARGGIVDLTDGASITFTDWRFNVRTSNTEPLLRLNIESKNPVLLKEKIEELRELIKQMSSSDNSSQEKSPQSVGAQVSDRVR